MIDHERAEEMQVNNEAPPGCLKPIISHYNPQDHRGSIEGFLENDEKKNDSIAVDKVWEASPLPNQGFGRPFYRQEFHAWPHIYSDYQMLRQPQPYGFENQFYQINRDPSFPIEKRVQFPFKMVSHGYHHDAQLQEFQYFVVIDFEATCDKENNPQPQEIIEFPSVLVNSATGQLEASFQTYVRPAYHQSLTDFCKELTGIQQIQVDRGVPLSEALLMHDKWLEDKGIKHKNFAVVTWSNWDCRVMLESECRFKRIRKPPYFNRWINLKVPFQEVYGGVRCNLKDAVQLAGLTWEGRAHCGLDDARNTARLLALLMHRGFKFSITNSLVWQPAPQSITCQPSPDRSPDPTTLLQHKAKEILGPRVQVNNNPYAGGNTTVKDRPMYCYCGVLSRWNIVRKPGPMQGRYFYGCGNWTMARRAICPYFAWAS
jgi:ERI1 exoribonuclease 2